jgi:glutaminyl-tRNA synthetase
MSDTPRTNFIRQIIDEDLATGKHEHIKTRFPPEPNGYLHIGHAKSIVLNFGVAEDFGGTCNLRFDDTNPHKENVEFVESIKADVRWLGYDWDDRLFFASDYFEQLYGFAEELIGKGLAYVCDLSAEETRAYRGTLTEPGRDSPYRDRSVSENLDLFRRMRAGEFPNGARALRAKIDMASPNINLRDPVLYRIRHGVIHHQTGSEWCLYPTYDYTHPISDALEGITHSLCTLEFEDHRPLYDWCIDNVSVPSKPRQIEFSRLNLEYTVMSKRLLTQLVEEGICEGWDDPRMPTVAGLRRRGFTPGSIRTFCDRIGVTKADNLVEMGILESAIRDDLDDSAPARHGRAASAQGGADQPAGRMPRQGSPRRIIPSMPPWARARSRSARNSISTAPTSNGCRRRASSAWCRAARCACATPT